MLNVIVLPSPSIGNKARETFKGTDHPIKSLDLRRAEVFYIQRQISYRVSENIVEQHSRSHSDAIKNANLISKIVLERFLFFT